MTFARNVPLCSRASSCRARTGAGPGTPHSAAIPRRAFLGQAAGSVGAASLVLWTGACASVMVRIVPPQGGTLRLPLAEFPDLGLPSGSVHVRPSAADPVLHVLALGGRRFAAVSSVCSHLGCAVEVQGERLVCPCHGSTYDREGRVLKGPAERALARYPTTVTDDDVVVVELGSASR